MAEKYRQIEGEGGREAPEGKQFSLDAWLRSIKKRFERVSQEGRGELPPIEITVFSPKHGTAKDARGFYSLVRSSDIVIPEAHDWKKKQLFMYQMVADGFFEPSPHVSDSKARDFSFAILDALHLSGVKVGFIDVPFKKRKQFSAEQRQPEPITSFAQLIDVKRHDLQQAAKEQKEREAYWMSRLIPCIKTLVRAYPELKQKDKLKVLIQMGAAHGGFYFDLLKNKEFKTKRILQDSDTIFDYNSEAMRRFMTGKPVNDELIARAAFEGYFFDSLLRPFLAKNVHASGPVYTLLRRWVSLFSYEEIKDLFEKMLAADSENAEKIFRDHLRERLWQKKKFVETVSIFERETGTKFVF